MWDTVRRQLRQQHRLERALPPVLAAADAGAYPLSVTQRRLWDLEKAASGGKLAYNITYPMTVLGPLDYEALRLAIGDIVRRHAALRTAFVEREGGPVQVAASAACARLVFADLSVRGADGADQWLAGAAAHRFDLTEGAPFRVCVARRGPDEHVILLTGHHIALDGRSLGTLIHEIGEFYTGHVTGRPVQLPAPPAQIGDFVLWQEGWLGSERAEPYLSYWRGQLARPAFEHFCGPDAGPPTDRDYSGGRVERAIPAPVMARVAALAHGEDVSAVSVYLAAYQALVHLHTGRRFVVVGIPAANRGKPELSDVVGFLVNILPIPSEADSERTLREAARLAGDEVAGA